MGEFLRSTMGFPTVLFTFALAVVIAYWLFVLLTGFGADEVVGAAGDAGADSGEAQAPTAAIASAGIAVAWFVSLAGQVAVGGGWAGAGVLAVALVCGWLAGRAARALGRRLLPPEPGTSRASLVSRTCVIRTGTVFDTFGQAEAVGDDGAAITIQVRSDESVLRAGSTALIYDHDAAGDFFRFMRFDAPGDIEASAS